MFAVRSISPLPLVLIGMSAIAIVAGGLFLMPRSTDPPVATFASDVTQPVAARPSFVVRFTADHPLARAQSLASQGRIEAAENTARDLIAHDPQLEGLCFDRFTAGGYEIVLVACVNASVGDSAAFAINWMNRFAAMAGVEYADVNTIATPDRLP